ncbi:DNA-binding transcriptional regulator, LysR family [Chelatococcus sambhunathii]|uniref:DNA-binding transcriptional regulator, LysR family n=1 Tax=Chelatococcus sambhunathii TaxID=363953 RepID=A0ABP2A2X8_9HYPH|nr:MULTISPECIES: LysR family transcriptional regulator [Chelatococcus]CUA87888.1 DNA-binding transcriptional regulator, LysR family [Chelatococcus sambhunathii]
MPDFDDLKSFIEVVDSGGFGRAAKRLGIAKSIVSRRIARLEAELGTRLLTRTTRGISATEAGLAFKTRSERILADLAEAKDAVAQHGGGIVGTLRLSAPLSFGVKYVTPILAEMASAHPRLGIDVAYSDRVVDLMAERFDAAIRIGSLRDSTLIARKIAPVYGIVAASPDYIARHGRPETPDDLTRHECLVYTAASEPDLRFRHGTRWTSVRPRGRLLADNGDALLQWARSGLGIVVAPTFLAAEDIERGTLVPLLSGYEMPEAGIHVVRPPGAYVPAKVRLLIDTLVAHFGGEPYWDACLMHRMRQTRAPAQAAGDSVSAA